MVTMPALLKAAAIKSRLNNSGPMVFGKAALKNGCANTAFTNASLIIPLLAISPFAS